MEKVETHKGTGKLLTRDGNYRPGTYEIRTRDDDQQGHRGANGFFDIDASAPHAMTGTDEEFRGPATLVLSGGEEVDILLRGLDGTRVEIVGVAPLPEGS
ncbi:hypothetical protein SAMN05216548_10690 [Faunimonas pinastri]|uniref:Uncharacterized protein n=1 Tax=Faunimonas pinastri TaxID=1855383 RepID=A0A1H9HMJ2_9HYPH|nr:hypothetical protein [Faunimonas pinastri]SEQ63534.1 hypothetical protein SAMN05216548_10690 [Faunimonas pinastri]